MLKTPSWKAEKRPKYFFSFSSAFPFEAVFTYTAEELDPRSAICWSQWEVKDAQNHALIANLAWRYVLCPTKEQQSPWAGVKSWQAVEAELTRV